MQTRREKRDQRSASSRSSNRSPSPNCSSNCSLNRSPHPNQSQHPHPLDGGRPSHPEPRVMDVEENESWERPKIHAVPLIRYMGKRTQGLQKM